MMSFAQLRSRTKTSDNKVKNLFSEDEYEEFNAQVKVDWQSLKEGREEDAVLLQALSENWNITELLNVAKRRGKTWRWLAALADKQNEITGMALLSESVIHILGNANHAMLQKALNVIARNRRFAEKYGRDHGHDEYTESVVDNMQIRVMNLAPAHYDHLERRLQAMLGRIVNDYESNDSSW